jgi:hypothetical protein
LRADPADWDAGQVASVGKPPRRPYADGLFMVALRYGPFVRSFSPAEPSGATKATEAKSPGSGRLRFRPQTPSLESRCRMTSAASLARPPVQAESMSRAVSPNPQRGGPRTVPKRPSGIQNVVPVRWQKPIAAVYADKDALYGRALT